MVKQLSKNTLLREWLSTQESLYILKYNKKLERISDEYIVLYYWTKAQLLNKIALIDELLISEYNPTYHERKKYKEALDKRIECYNKYAENREY